MALFQWDILGNRGRWQIKSVGAFGDIGPIFETSREDLQQRIEAAEDCRYISTVLRSPGLGKNDHDNIVKLWGTKW